MLDRIRYVVLGTIDEDGRTRTSPVYFKPHGYEDLYWVSHPATHHSRNLRGTAGSAVSCSTRRWRRARNRAVYVTGTAREVPADELEQHVPHAFDPERGGRAFTRGGADRPPGCGCGCSTSTAGRCTSAAATHTRHRPRPAGAGGRYDSGKRRRYTGTARVIPVTPIRARLISPFVVKTVGSRSTPVK